MVELVGFIGKHGDKGLFKIKRDKIGVEAISSTGSSQTGSVESATCLKEKLLNAQR